MNLEDLLQQLEDGEINLLDLEVVKASLELDPSEASFDDYFAVTGALTVAPSLTRFRFGEKE